MSDFWSDIESTTFVNEATVETRLVMPLLTALGYDNFDISPKHPVMFQEGRKVGRRPEADFVVFYGPVQDRQTSLMVVEAKTPGESFSEAKAQAESYAFNIRAPFCLLTDGVTLEVWQLQPSQESECIISVPVASLSSHRGKLENLLSKEATFQYCKSLPHKTLVQVSSDVSSYISSELRRTSTNEQTISRLLVSDTRSKAEGIESTKLLEKMSGAVITGPSGYGKSTLARYIYSSALRQSWSLDKNPLPFDVPLPEFVECDQRLVEYLHARIFAHCPAISISRLEDELRERGAILVCDGVDRISALARPSVEASLRTILRDFPKVKLFVFSRENAKPNLPIPTLRLKELTAAEQQEMRVLASAVSNCQEVMWNLPGVLQKLCSHPLLLNLIINHLIRHRSVPNGIGDLFESWLASVLPSQASGPASSIDREDALSLLAAETIDKPLTKSRAIALLVERGLPKLVFDELSSHDAIVVSGMTVEVQHESLADYMRARSIVSLPEVEMRTALRSVPLRTDSLFPILLMALLPSRSMQRLVWERLAVLDLSTYLDALRFHADVSSDIVGGSRDDAARSYLEDILDGIMQPLDAFFDDVRLPAMEALAHEKCNELARLF